MQGNDELPIEHALRTHAIAFAFQPVMDLRTGMCLYVEALARWPQPTGEMRMPGDFLHLIDTPRLGDLLTESALEQTVDALPALRAHYGDGVRVGLNLSNVQLQGNAAALAVDAAGSTAVADWLTIEIVEDLAIGDIDGVRCDFAKMRDAGIRIMLDDFGTGNTTLTMLTDLAYDGLKLDRRYVSAIADSVASRVLVEALIRYGHGANVEVIAEGVEDVNVSNMLEDMQCRYAQGYFFQKPLLLEHLTQSSKSSSMRVATRATTTDRAEVALDPAAQSDEIAQRIVSQLSMLEPMTTNATFEDFIAQLEALEDEALTMHDADRQADLLIDIQLRRVVAARYFDRSDLVFTWGLELAKFCEAEGSIARQAQALALVAGCVPEDATQRNAASNAVVRVLQIRDRGHMSLDQLTRLDNSIGVIFSDLGLTQHGRGWWLNSYRRGRGSQLRAMFLTCLNLLEHTLTMYEVPVSPDVGAVSAADLELLDEMLLEILPIPALAASVHASFLCRRHVLVGDLDAARQAIADRGDAEPTGILEVCHALRADAVLARASNDVPAFIEATSALVAARPDQGMLLLQLRAIDRLRAEALALAGRYEEAYAFLEGVLAAETNESVRSKSRVYAWLQSQAGLDQPFASISNI